MIKAALKEICIKALQQLRVKLYFEGGLKI